MKNKSPNFEWYMVPSVVFVALIILTFVWSIADGIHQSALNAQTPSCTDDCTTDEGDPGQ